MIYQSNLNNVSSQFSISLKKKKKKSSFHFKIKTPRIETQLKILD